MKCCAWSVVILIVVIVVICAGVIAIITGPFEVLFGTPEAELRAAYRVELLQSMGDYSSLLVQVALDEYEEYGNQAGAGVRYWSHFNHGVEGWCCDFVYYVADICGYVDGTENTGDYPIFGGVTAWPPLAWYQLIQAGGQYFTVYQGTPEPGDIIFYYNTDSGYAAYEVQTWCVEDICHIGIVVDVPGEYSVTVVEGNLGGMDSMTSIVGKYTHADTRTEVWDGTAVYAYVRPNYPASETYLVGDLSYAYYYNTSDPDVSYSGHAVTGLTSSQIAAIKNTIYGEYGSNLAGAIAVAQSIRDNVDRSPSITYDNFYSSCKYYGYNADRDKSEYETDIVNTAFDYVFNLGGSAIQHPIYCFYAKTDTLQSDADYQALFVAELEFVLEVGNVRYFSWDTGQSTESLSVKAGDYLNRYTDDQTGDYLDYWMFVPEDATDNMPLIIFLHGDSEAGNVSALKNYGFIQAAKEIYGNNFPFIAISPNTRVSSWTSGTIPQTLKGLIDYVVEEMNIDPDHIIITGHSRGAMGVWNMVSTYGSFFSAAVPISCGSETDLVYTNLADVPIRAFVGGYESGYYNAMNGIVNRIKNAGGEASLTSIDGMGHGDMKTAAYTWGLIQWMITR